MSKRPGKIVELVDGRKGIVYNDQPLSHGRLFINLVNDKYEPLTNTEGKKLISCKMAEDVKLIGYVD